MSKKTKIIISIINTTLMILMLLGLFLLLKNLELIVKIPTCILIVALGIATPLAMLLGKDKLCKSLFVFNITLGVVLGCFFLLNVTRLFDSLSDLEKIKELILESGGLGVFVCFFLVLANVIILPIPAMLLYLAIVAVYGSWIGFLISYVGTVIGSIVAFWIGKKIGKTAVVWCIGKDDTEKYAEILNKKGKVPFILMQILPFFPDDVLCMIAGLTSMSYKFFILSMIFIKPIYISFVCFLGTGNIIPFSGWGIPVWIAIFAIIGVICILYMKYQDKIDAWFSNKFKRKK